jgi:hypothetical protein
MSDLCKAIKDYDININPTSNELEKYTKYIRNKRLLSPDFVYYDDDLIAWCCDKNLSFEKRRRKLRKWIIIRNLIDKMLMQGFRNPLLFRSRSYTI